MKKFTALLLTFVLFLSLCPVSGLAEEAGKIRVVTTIFPIYDWVREIAGDTGNTEITLLLDSGVDLHSFQPSAQDILKVATCDLFIYVGGESDEWAEDALAEAVNPDMVVISLVEALGENAKAEEIVEGMQAEEEEEEGEEGEEEEEEIDEHVWLSLRNAQVFTSAIADALAQKDPANADSYRANAEAYGAKLAALDAAYAGTVDSAAHKTLLFGDRFPFRYLTDDYGLTYYAAFAGCSAETEASTAAPRCTDHRRQGPPHRGNHHRQHGGQEPEAADPRLHAGNDRERYRAGRDLPENHGRQPGRTERSTELTFRRGGRTAGPPRLPEVETWHRSPVKTWPRDTRDIRLSAAWTSALTRGITSASSEKTAPERPR